MSTLRFKFDGEYQGEPYVIDSFHYDDNISIEEDSIIKARDIKDPVQKLVYMFLDSFSCGTIDDTDCLVFYRICYDQIAELFGLSLEDVEKAMSSLLSEGKVIVLAIDGYVNAYATV